MGGRKQCLFSSIHRDTLYITGTLSIVQFKQTDRPTATAAEDVDDNDEDNDEDAQIQLVDNRTGLWNIVRS